MSSDNQGKGKKRKRRGDGKRVAVFSEGRRLPPQKGGGGERNDRD